MQIDRSSHLAGFSDDFKKDKIHQAHCINNSNPCSDCPSASRETGYCNKAKKCQPYMEYMAETDSVSNEVRMMQGTAG
jgi:hypothetical protein